MKRRKKTDQIFVEKFEMSGLLNKVVEEPTVLRDITNNRVQEDEGKGKCWNHRRKSEIARERWKILAKALLKPRKISPKSVKSKNISVRRFTNFGLIAPNKLDSLDCWLKYTAKNFTELYMIEIHHLEQNLTAKDLIGFNNTGNICIWPSEEVLAYYLLSNINWFKGKEILEVGGGMTCMAGIMLAKYGKVKRVDLTDGNFTSVENVNKIIRKNQLDKSKVSSFELNWKDHKMLTKKYDAVLSSDCLFFDETRSDLVETIWQSLRDDGVAFVMAPKRGKTLDCFVKIATKRGFYCFIQTYYEESVWKQHLKFKEFCPETDYWVSQERKFCEFCKCSIADNKASVQFHENGKKHKENVAKRLTEMQKKATREAKEAADFDREMKRMEAAALKAYLSNDVKSNGDFTSQLIQSGAVTLSVPDSEQDSTSSQTKKSSCQKTPPVKKWLEAVSDEGRTYYWNKDTGESVWEKPKCGYISLSDQGKVSSSKAPKEAKEAKEPKEAKKAKKPKKQGKPFNIKLKEKSTAVKKEEKASADSAAPVFESQPYGTWQKVEVVKQEPVDLQLPEQEFVKITVPKIREESERKFKDKTSTVGFTSFTQGDTTFKKRKLASGSKKNLRQRLDDD